MILRLAELTYDDHLPARIGGKGAGLVRLFNLGLPVPPAVALPVESEGRVDAVDEIVGYLGEPLAVRSSAVGEDAEDRSGAGQYESLMNVRAGTLIPAIQQVYDSRDLGRARAYRGAETAGMAIVIQRAIQPTRAGVAFSRDPLTGTEDVLIECVFGHGEELVSGRAQPDRYRLRPDGSVRTELVAKQGEHRLLRTLRDDEVCQVGRLVAAAERGFGRPVDVEFCFEGRQLWLVQCRAITTPR